MSGTIQVTSPPGTTGAGGPPPPLSRREQLLSVAFGAWMIVGLFLDGWAHNNEKPETLLTPWHGVFYSGFIVTAGYSLLLLRRRLRPGSSWRERVPPGLGLVLVGLGLFGVGGAGDQVWHGLFGIEVDVEALLSPTHLLLFAGGMLILTGAFRAAWADGTSMAPSLREFLPPLLSISLASALVAFFFMYLTPFGRGNYGTWIGDYTAMVTTDSGTAADYAEDIRVVGIASLLIANLIYVASLLLLLRRWRPPFGTATILFTSVTALVGSLDLFAFWVPLLAAPLAGLATDALIHYLQPSAANPAALRAVAIAAPVFLWLSFFALFHLDAGVGWSPELWGGVTVMAGLSGGGLSLLVAPPPLPPAAVPVPPSGPPG
ncbi:MAG: hypothetical protein ABR540_20165 [Acidimicrobiales bacterium]